jgi:hypothetical protein
MTMKTKNKFLLAAGKRLTRKGMAFCCLCLAVALLTACHHKKRQALTGEVYKSGSGYGYKILVQGKTLINQPYIPVVPGETPFCDSLDAAKTCNRVIDNIKHKKSPSVTREDLAVLTIKTNCK